MDEQPSLGQLVWMLRRELEWAQQVDSQHSIRFDVDSVEVETDVAITRTRKGEAGLEIKVLGIGGGKATGSQQSTEGTTSTLRMKLKPRDLANSNGRLEISAVDTEED